MSRDLAAPALRRLILRLVRWCAVAGLLLVAACALLYATRGRWLGPWIARAVEREVAERTGAELSIGALDGGWLADVELRDVRWRDPATGAALAELDVRSARASYSLVALLRGEPEWLRRVEIEGLRARAHLGGGGDADPTGGSLELPARLPAISVREADVLLTTQAGRLELRGGGLELDPPDDGRQPARLALERVDWRALEGPSLRAGLEADLAWRAPRLELEALRLDGVERARASWVDLGALGRGQVDFGADVSVFEGRVAAEGGWREGALDAAITLERASLEPALSLFLPDAEGLPQAVLTGTGALHLEPAQPDALRADFEGRAESVRVADRDVDDVRGEVALAGGELSIARLSVRRGTGSLEVARASFPLGLDLWGTLRAARGSIELVATDLPAWLGTPMPEGSLARRAPPHSLELSARFTEQGLALERGRLTTSGGRFDVRPSAVTWGEGERMLEEARLALDLGVDFRDLADLGPVLAIEGAWAGSLRGGLSLNGTWRSVVGRLDVEGVEVVAGDVPLGELRVVADIDAEQARVDELRSIGPLGRIELEGSWLLEAKRFEQARVSLATSVPEQVLPGLLAGGSVEVDARISGSPFDPRGEFVARCEGLALAVAPDEILEQLEVAGRLEQGLVRLRRLRASSRGVELSLSGALEHADWTPPLAVRLETLSARRDALDLALVEPARVAFDGAGLSTGLLRFSGSAGDLSLAVERDETSLDARLEATRLDPMPLLAPLVPPGFELEGMQGLLEARLAEGELTARTELSVARLRPSSEVPPLALDLRSHLAGGRIVIERIAVDAGEGRGLELSGQAPFDPLGSELLGAGPLELQGRLGIGEVARLPALRPGAGLELSGQLGAAFDLEGSWELLRGEASVTGTGLSLTSRSGTAVFGPAELTARLALEGDSVHASQVRLQAPGQVDLDGSGSLELAVDARAWLSGRPPDLAAAPLRLDLNLDAADLAFLARFSPALRRVAGRIDGALSVRGTALEPELNGSLALAAGELRFTADIPTLEGVDARFALEPGRLRLERLRGELGGGPVEGEGQVAWQGGATEVELALRGSEVLLLRQPTLRVRADADLHVAGPLEAMRVTGSLGVRESRYTKKVELFRSEGPERRRSGPALELFSFEQGALAGMTFDVEVRSVDAFRIENNLVNGSVRADLKLGGTGRSPELLGAMFVDPSRVRLPASVLETTAGTIQFGREDPLVPQLDVRLSTRVRGFDVDMRVTGTADEPEVELTSIPPLPPEDLLLLVLTGKPPELTWDARTSEQAAQTVAFFVGKDLLLEWFSDPEAAAGDSWLDRIEWRSGSDVTRSGEETSELTIRVSGSEWGTGRKVLLRAENDVFDRVNFGVRFVIRLD